MYSLRQRLSTFPHWKGGTLLKAGCCLGAVCHVSRGNSCGGAMSWCHVLCKRAGRLWSIGTLWLCQKSYGKWPFIVVFPSNIVMFHSYVKLLEGNDRLQQHTNKFNELCEENFPLGASSVSASNSLDLANARQYPHILPNKDYPSMSLESSKKETQ